MTDFFVVSESANCTSCDGAAAHRFVVANDYSPLLGSFSPVQPFIPFGEGGEQLRSAARKLSSALSLLKSKQPCNTVFSRAVSGVELGAALTPQFI